MTRAREVGLDLVEVDANGNPPVCRLLDYGKWKYEQAKKERDARKHQLHVHAGERLGDGDGGDADGDGG